MSKRIKVVNLIITFIFWTGALISIVDPVDDWLFKNKADDWGDLIFCWTPILILIWLIGLILAGLYIFSRPKGDATDEAS
jgi:hypothetical protein